MWQNYYFLICEVKIGVQDTVGYKFTSKNTERKMFPFKINSQSLTSFSKRFRIIFSADLRNVHLGRFMGSNINVFLLIVSTLGHKSSLDCHLHRTGYLSYTDDRVCTLSNSVCLKRR